MGIKILSKLIALASLSGLTSAWLPETDKQISSINGKNLFSTSNGKVRGANLGNLFVFEPWIAEDIWSDMGCKGQESEFDCVSSIGQEAANNAFEKHWGSWITQEDIHEIQSYGLNTIRVPVGYWMKEDLVSATEHFPQGGFDYLEKLCGWASDAGLYIIIDLHGLPGAQTPNNSFTGQYIANASFYQDYQYDRAVDFLGWMTTKIHQSDKFRNVGMLEIVNEPVQEADKANSMRSIYYPEAFKMIRTTEKNLNIEKSDYLHIQVMDKAWGSGDPTEFIDDLYYTAYDGHIYLKWAGIKTKDAYINTSCSDLLDNLSPTIVGEWSLSVADETGWDSDWNPASNTDFYKRWFAAQATTYEKRLGWIFWTWKAELGDYRWSYKDAVTAGVIPTNLNSVFDLKVCA
ncbi:uncharacterized protein N7487_002147 [Penicillium crustosum]|uniref:uncharacterized protein n=1 Tax=Penicillium crustosum TaxID=36656 RepID=UPI00239F9983|nr:uncharacterized protein N7487_002147 [Penicillium crustosum]KAJ5418597.1 hypothetical protein N7487_002147 [Penicillium crustosum]